VFHNFFKKTFTKNSNNSSGNDSSTSTVLNPMSWARRCFKGPPSETPADDNNNNWSQDNKQPWTEDMKAPSGGTPIPMGSFVRAHEEGLQDSMSPVAEGYDQPISPRPIATLASKTSHSNLIAPMPTHKRRQDPSPSYSSSSDERKYARRSMRTFWKTANKPAPSHLQSSSSSRDSWRARQALWSRAYRMDSDVRAEDDIEIARPVARTTYPAI